MILTLGCGLIFPDPWQNNSIIKFPCAPPSLDSRGWLIGGSWDARGFIPRVERYEWALIRCRPDLRFLLGM